VSIICPEHFLEHEVELSDGDNRIVKSTIGISWDKPANVPLEPLAIHDGKPCVEISRATLMSLFALTNARPIFSYSSTSGYRSAYPSYSGQWSISWPIGKPCTVSLAAHDSHTAETDVYPSVFSIRLDKCIEMLAGIISASGRKLAFPGRAKGIGPWQLCELRKGFPGAHGSRHFYNMMGGKVFEVDLLILRKLPDALAEGQLKIQVPSVISSEEMAEIHIFEHEDTLLAQALDCLPWASLSWPMHRGMRDILVAYGKPVMDRYRAHLGNTLKNRMAEVEKTLIVNGWNEGFVQNTMGDMAESSILSGGGNSGDLVRIVVAIVDALFDIAGSEARAINKDETRFWRQTVLSRKEERLLKSELSLEEIVALTKFFVLEWLQELDYQLYHELPVKMYMT
jgi:hypothetical protein